MTRYLMCFVLIAACGGRTAYQHFPGAPAAFDRAASDPKAVEIADKVFAAAGGAGNWEKAKQIKWRQTITTDGKVALDGEEVWDRWNARHLGLLHRTDGTRVVVAYELYGNFSIGYVQQPGEKEIKKNMDAGSRERSLKLAKELYNMDTAVLTMQFLMLEPGAKLEYVGQVKDDAGGDNYDELKVTFADPLRKDLEFHPVIDRATHTILRIEILKVGGTTKIGYILKDWTTAGGLKFATARTNLGHSGETIAIKDITVGDVDDNLFIAPITH